MGDFGAGRRIEEGTGSCGDTSADTYTHYTQTPAAEVVSPTPPKPPLIRQMLSGIRELFQSREWGVVAR